MAHDPQRQRKRKRLLVASIGVATVSFMGLQTGCGDDSDGDVMVVANLLAVPLDGSIDFAPIADAARDAQRDAYVPPIPVSGNLLSPNYYDAGEKDAANDALTATGNLLPPPDAATDAARDGAAKDGSAPKDAHVDTSIPPSGNLLPPIGPR